MLIRDMFRRDISREIQGVIKVGQNDENSRYHELEEYVVTRELLRHFSLFYENYRQSLERPTDEMGVWISGFFGSGKSHFLKILSYLLDNEPVKGQKPVDFFEAKIDDAVLYAEMKRSARFDCETILFNIDSKSPLGIKSDKEAILKVFLKVFYDHLGFYGDDLKVVELEKYLHQEGQLQEFQTNFEAIRGMPWMERRNCYFFDEDAIVQALSQTTGMSEASARNWYNHASGTNISIEQFAKEVKAYVNSKGDKFHLIFLVDEIGQYIGDNAQLMLNLQTVVEDLGIHCQGNVWVIVTSQEDIDSVTKVKGNDFSKIQGRFKTRLSLSSASVDEVIKKRLLEKKELANDKLTLIYSEQAAALKNLLHFSEGTAADLKGYSGQDEFCSTYPFVPYQFRLLQNVFTQIRKHGASGKHLAEGERSMLSAFQDAAKKMADAETGVLAPFQAFYDSVHEFLDGSIQRVIARAVEAAAKGDVLKIEDVGVLKLLFLIRYIDGDIRANLDNISTLMIDTINQDKLGLKADIKQSLTRLASQNYVQKNADEYRFLTDDEQDINREIKNTVVDKSLVVEALGKYFFNDIYEDQKYKYSPRYNLSFNSKIDETTIGAQTAKIGLRILTQDADDYDADEAKLKMDSAARNDLIIRLDDSNEYFDEMHEALKIDRFDKTKKPSVTQAGYKIILAEKQEEANQRRTRARALLEEAIYRGRHYVNGEKAEPRGATAKERINNSLKTLVESVYTKLPYIIEFADSDGDIQKILQSQQSQGAMMGQDSDPNHLAAQEVMAYIDLQDLKHVQITMKNVLERFEDEPYGWREIDIAAVVARLFKNQKVRLQYQGSFLDIGDQNIVTCLRKKTDIDKLIIKKRQTLSAQQLKVVRELSKELFNVIDLPKDEDGLINRFLEEISKASQHLYEDFLFYYQSKNYPGRETVKQGLDIFKTIKENQADHAALLNVLTDYQNQLLDWDEDMKLVEGFFKNQRIIFDKGLEMSRRIDANRSYLYEQDFQVRSGELDAILENPQPYKEIVKIPDLLAVLDKRFNELLNAKKASSRGILQKDEADLMAAARQDSLKEEQQSGFISRISQWYRGKYQHVADSQGFESLDAVLVQSSTFKNKIWADINKVIDDNRLKGDDPPVQPQIHIISIGELASDKPLVNEKDVDEYAAGLAGKLKQIIRQNKIIRFKG